MFAAVKFKVIIAQVSRWFAVFESSARAGDSRVFDAHCWHTRPSYRSSRRVASPSHRVTFADLRRLICSGFYAVVFNDDGASGAERRHRVDGTSDATVAVSPTLLSSLSLARRDTVRRVYVECRACSRPRHDRELPAEYSTPTLHFVACLIVALNSPDRRICPFMLMAPLHLMISSLRVYCVTNASNSISGYVVTVRVKHTLALYQTFLLSSRLKVYSPG